MLKKCVKTLLSCLQVLLVSRPRPLNFWMLGGIPRNIPVGNRVEDVKQPGKGGGWGEKNFLSQSVTGEGGKSSVGVLNVFS